VALLFRRSQHLLHVDASDDEHAIVSRLDLAGDLPREAPIRYDLARCQRAPEGSDQSTADRGDHVVDSRSMGSADIFHPHSIVLGDRAMSAEDDRVRFTRQIRIPQWSLLPLDPRP
jgi:hypothetical protein